MFKNIIYTITGLVFIAVAFVEVSAFVLTLTLVIGGSIVALFGLWDLSEEQDVNRYHLFE